MCSALMGSIYRRVGAAVRVRRATSSPVWARGSRHRRRGVSRRAHTRRPRSATCGRPIAWIATLCSHGVRRSRLRAVACRHGGDELERRCGTRSWLGTDQHRARAPLAAHARPVRDPGLGGDAAAVSYRLSGHGRNPGNHAVLRAHHGVDDSRSRAEFQRGVRSVFAHFELPKVKGRDWPIGARITSQGICSGRRLAGRGS